MQRDCPIISATPDELETVLRDCLAGKYDFDELGRRGRRYVEKYYAIDAVARELARTYLETANFPAENRTPNAACGGAGGARWWNRGRMTASPELATTLRSDQIDKWGQ